MAAPSPVIVVLTGATAVGKTDLALQLARKLPVDIVSLDSAMVYRGMDIGTAKPPPEVLRRYPHALVDIRDPTQPYSAAEFLRDADAAVSASLARGRIPLLVGGSMLYLKVFREGLAEMPGADAEFRARLRAEAAEQGWPALYQRLRHLDPAAAARIHPHNAARIERALEVCVLSGRPMSSFWAGTAASAVERRHGVRLRAFAVEPDSREALHQRIAERLDAMFARGFVEEVAALRGRGDLDPELPALRAVGYRQIWEHLEGRCSAEEMRGRALAATRQLAKRQLTWLRSFSLESLEWGPTAEIARRVLASLRLELS